MFRRGKTTRASSVKAAETAGGLETAIRDDGAPTGGTRERGLHGPCSADDRDAIQPLREPERAGGGVRAATGQPDHGEPTDPQHVGELRHIGGPVEEAAPRIVGEDGPLAARPGAVEAAVGQQRCQRWIEGPRRRWIRARAGLQ